MTALAAPTPRLHPFAAEWVKARTLRSTPWTVGVTMTLSVGFNVLASVVSAAQWDSRGGDGFDLVGVILQPGAAIAQLGFLVVAALLVTGEYGGGTMSPTLLGVPRRAPVLVAKAAVVGALALVLGLVAGAISFGVGAVVYGDKTTVSLFHDDLWRVVLGFPLTLLVTALFALGLAAVVRHTAAALGTVIALVVVLPSVVGALPGKASEWVAMLMPGGWSFHSVLLANGDDEVLGPWAGFGVSIAWTAVALGLGLWSLTRRDA